MPKNGGKSSARSKAKTAKPLLRACVGIAAAPDADALSRLFAALPADTGASFVVTVQRDGLSAANTVKAIAAASSLPVTLAIDEVTLEPDRIYVAGDSAMVTVQSGQLSVSGASPADGRL